ncbi:hypothetical protein FNF31_00374 [Cafeteria roenbergensis]|uniref:J domain-containing protein n=1 Tax=Cafeteria roenbergensis TaxID=33653 RepID=A0A5A8E0E1_CAFRO|nr:hypothetical protein FNF31_00374 [Cafeteria roenbergensis]KAA0171222.1 hypothetical protein FNF28_00987 [Cafeteria roenbergensis]
MAAASGRSSVRECHYDVLAVSMDATDSEIRKAYRKAALKWHPDKNPGREAEATERMKLVTEAYGVLSDATERAWYDAHRESILHGGGSGAADSTTLLPNLFTFFSTSCFSGFGEDKEGFYSVYARAFDSVARAEARHRPRGSAARDWPAFGTASSEWSDVAAFYRSWTNYASDMTFAWEDAHNTNEAPNRLTRRWMERENAKAHHKAREEWTDLVRTLAKFARKRDPRVAAEAQRLREEREARQAAREARNAAAKAAAAASAEALAQAAEEYREELEAASGFRLADEGPARRKGEDEAKPAAAPAAADSGGAGGSDEQDDDGDGDGDGDGAADGTDVTSKADRLDALLKSVDMTRDELCAEYEATRELLVADGSFKVTRHMVLETLREDGTLPRELTDGLAAMALKGGRHGQASSSAPGTGAGADVSAAPDAGTPETVIILADDTGDQAAAAAEGAAASGAGAAPSEPAGGEAAAGGAAPAADGDAAEPAPPQGRPCRVCNEVFPNVPALLEHIKESGHQAPTSAAKPAAGSGSGKRRKGKGAKAGGGAFVCAACGLGFPTRSRMFRHLEETGHAVAPSQVEVAASAAAAAASKKGGKGKKSKKGGRRKGQRGADDSD